MPLGSIRPADLTKAGPWLQFGVAPNRVDVLTAVDALDFDGAWERRVLRALGRVTVPVLAIDDLIRNKRAVGRHQDLADAERLERRRAEGSGGGRVSERARSRRRRSAGRVRRKSPARRRR